MKLIHKDEVGFCPATFSVGLRADAFQGLLELHDFGDLDPDEVRMPCPSVTLGGVRFMWLPHHTTDACSRVLPQGDQDPAFPLQLLVTRDGHCVTYAASGYDADPAADSTQRAQTSSAAEGWLIGLPASLITRWLRITPATAAYRLDAESDGARALCTYLGGWRYDEFEALVSPFEQELIAEHVMSLLAMAISQHS